LLVEIPDARILIQEDDLTSSRLDLVISAQLPRSQSDAVDYDLTRDFGEVADEGLSE
jgi:hypothetical protein